MEQIKLNTIPSGVPSVCHISQFDNTSRIIRCHLFNDSDPLTLTGSETIRLFMRKSNNSRAEFEIESTSGTFIDLVITSEMSDIAGDSECKFQIADSEKTIGTLNFKMVVEPDAYGDSLKTRSISGPIATFETDLAEDLIKLDVDIEPVQDLHGYDYPWPAGGGKNKLDMKVYNGGSYNVPVGTQFTLTESATQFTKSGNNYTVSTSSTWRYFTVYAPVKANSSYYLGYVLSATGATCGYSMYLLDEDYKVLTIYNNTDNPGTRNWVITTTNDTAYVCIVFTNRGTAVNTLTISEPQLVLSSSATPYEPYENICPISGHDSAQLFRTGKNLLDTRQESIPQYASGPQTYAGVTYSPNNDGSITINGTSTGASVLFFDPVTLNPIVSYPFPTWKYTNNRYTLSVTDEWGLVTGDAYIQATVKKIKDDSIVSRQRLTASVFTRSFTVREDEYIADAFVRLSSGASASNINIKIQLELGSTATDYEPYESDPTPIIVRFGQTIYKGRVISESDLIEITHVCETFDGSSDEQWVATSSPSVRYGFRSYFQNNKKPTAKATDEMLSSTIPLRTTSEAASVDDDIITCRSTTYLHKIFYIFAPPSKISTVEELRAFLANEPETVMYPLDEHIFLKISDLFISDNEAYLYRQSGGSVEVLDREIDSLAGGTIGWNQISALTRAASESYGITTEISNGLLTITGTPTQSSGQWRLMLDTRFSAIPTGHKLLLCGNTEHFWFRVQGADTTKTTKTQKEIMLEASSTTIADIVIMMANMDTSVAVNESVYLQLFDLTVMFGSVIADYIYALEQTTAGAGVAWFRERFPKNYYPYNPGQLISVKTSKHITTGKNLITANVPTDRECWGTSQTDIVDAINSLPVGTYTISNKFKINELPSNGKVDHGRIYITAMVNGSQVPVTTYSVATDNSPTLGKVYSESGTFQITEANKGKINHAYLYCDQSTTHSGTGRGKYDFYDLQLELGSTPTDYTPYVGYEYPLDPNLELRGIPKLDGNKMYYDGDTYESSGSVTRKYGIIDLGTITWTATPITNAGNRFYSSTFYSAKKPLVTSIIPNIICSKYEAKLVSAYSQAVNGITISTNGSLQVYDVNMSSLTAAQFKTAMSGVYLVYELDTPTTESAASFENPQRVDPNGVEMYEDTRDIPLVVGHETKYLLNPETPTILTALVGTNNVYSDAGDVDVEYYTTLEGGND